MKTESGIRDPKSGDHHIAISEKKSNLRASMMALMSQTKSADLAMAADSMEVLANEFSKIDNTSRGAALVALVLDGVSAKWQMNLIQMLATPTSLRVNVEGHGTVEPIAFVITQEQARLLVAQIIQTLGPIADSQSHGLHWAAGQNWNRWWLTNDSGADR
jgi:hypothetical protein